MPRLTIRDLPPEVYDRLRDRAKRHRRSIAQEAAAIIEQALGKAKGPVHAHLPHASRRGISPEVVLDRHWVTLYFSV